MASHSFLTNRFTGNIIQAHTAKTPVLILLDGRGIA